MSQHLSDVETHWSRMERAKLDTPEGRAALADVIRDYWQPLYLYLRRRGHDRDEAQDLTQSFVAFMLETQLIQKADPSRGSFRGLLKTALNNFVRERHRKQRTQRRGGAIEHLELDFATAETRYESQVDPALTPDQVLHQAWALAFRDHVTAEVEKYYARDKPGKEQRVKRFRALLPFVFDPPGYGELAAAGKALDMDRYHAAVFLDRLAERWRNTARKEAAGMVGTLEGGDVELRALGLGGVLEGDVVPKGVWAGDGG